MNFFILCFKIINNRYIFRKILTKIRSKALNYLGGAYEKNLNENLEFFISLAEQSGLMNTFTINLLMKLKE